MNDDIVDYGLGLSDGCQSLAFSRHKSEVWLAVGDRAGGIRILPVFSGAWELEAVRRWSAHAGRVYALAVAPDRGRIVSGGADGRVMLWEPFPPDPAVPPELLERWNDWDMFADGRIAIAGSNRLYLCDSDFRILSTLETSVRKVGAARDAGLVFFASRDRDKSLAVWNPATGTMETCWEEPDAPNSFLNFAATPDGRVLFALPMQNSEPNRLLHVDVSSKKVVQTITFERASKPPAIAPNGRWLAFTMDDEICIYDIASASITRRWHAPRNGILTLCFSPDSARLATAASNRAVSIWDHATGELLFEVMAHRQYSTDVCFSPDGRRLATFGADSVVRVWDGRSASPLLEWPCGQTEVQQLRFSADGHRLIGRSYHGRFLLLDGTPGSETADGDSH